VGLPQAMQGFSDSKFGCHRRYLTRHQGVFGLLEMTDLYIHIKGFRNLSQYNPRIHITEAF